MTGTSRWLQASLLLAGILLNGTAFASNWVYAEAGASRATLDVAGTKFNPVLPRVKLGFFITQKIILEVQYAGSGDDTVANTQVQIEDLSAAFLRLDSDFRGSMRMYLLLGGAETNLQSSTASGSNVRKEKYKDFAWGIGMEDRTWSKHTLLTLEYTEYYNHDDVVIYGVSLGFKFEY